MCHFDFLDFSDVLQFFNLKVIAGKEILSIAISKTIGRTVV